MRRNGSHKSSIFCVAPSLSFGRERPAYSVVVQKPYGNGNSSISTDCSAAPKLAVWA